MRKKLRLILIFSLSLALISFLIIGGLPKVKAAGTTYYISSSTGNDSNSGTSQSSPWKTLQKVSAASHNGQINAGDSFLLKQGDT